MSTVTSKIISEEYNISDFKFELMYMPMNSIEFENDLYAEVCLDVLGFALLIMVKIG